MRRLLALVAFLLASSGLTSRAFDVSTGGIGRWVFAGDSITGFGWFEPMLVDANAYYAAPTFAKRPAAASGRAAVLANGARAAVATVGTGSGTVFPLLSPVPITSVTPATQGMFQFAGVGGNTVSMLVARLSTDVIAPLPPGATHVWIEIGVNDLRTASPGPTDPTAFRASCDSLLSTLKSSLPGVQLVWLLPYYCSLNCSNANVDQYDTIIQASATASGGVQTIDQRNITVTTVDGLHPDTAGKQTMSDYVWSQIYHN